MDDFDLDEKQSFSLKQYIRQQKELIILDYELETKDRNQMHRYLLYSSVKSITR